MLQRNPPMNVFTFEAAIAFESKIDDDCYNACFERAVACTLFHLGSSGGFRETAQAFGVSKSWCMASVNEIVRFHLCCGAMDGTLIAINRLHDFEGWYNRKGFPSVNVQAVCDHRKRFLSFDVRPGSWSDAKIFQHSSFGRNISRLLPRGHHVLADSGYGVACNLQLQFVIDAHGD
ncbi:hypothetical protein PHYSODRAFT_485604 [Phytophthora sojae]|uniref:DDE Tnp4 domain-containing protein n=1 Tax=Phytophthora sojae (strain P6497) TaxID=1094619 RepID=G4Z1C2_PHYSP|nr:hypothetical protein PHYSODRAFT_485604 [Phytophthora sojae]EGZ25270.1 hypothetical protein PHYSODRAFT_485604 [Phytophthora sojae]|eukprot:XP_009520558.1 hypothetical protein PHYSODRAFT_485604 [Phytophthora sojae]